MSRLYKKHMLVLLVGALLLVHSAYLASVKVTHFGVMVPAILGIVLLFVGFAGERWTAWLHARPRALVAWRVALCLFGIWLVTLTLFFGVLYKAGEKAVSGVQPAVIIVLGSSTPGAQPSPALAKRLDLALEMARRFPAALVVSSGGVDVGETVAEGDVMSAYLGARGLASRRSLVEGRSTSTHENLTFSQRLVKELGVKADAPVLIVTSDFHTLRAERIARKAGWSNVSTAGAETPLYMRYNAWLREYFAWVSGRLLREY